MINKAKEMMLQEKVMLVIKSTQIIAYMTQQKYF